MEREGRAARRFGGRREGRAPSLALAFLLAVSHWACVGASDDTSADAGSPEGACAAAVKVGSFAAQLNDGFTSVQGTVANGVTPRLVPDVADSQGDCRLLRPPSLSCTPACDVGMTCDASGTCIPEPENISVGTVTLSGLKSPISMTAEPPVYFYMNTASLEHPGFEEGAYISLSASGEGEVVGFSLDARGVAPLEVAEGPVHLERGEPVELSWSPPGQDGLSGIHVNLNIAQHGGTPAWIECEVPDTGAFEIPTSLSDQLLDLGFSGFPTVQITRRSADSTSTSLGCIQLLVQSPVDVEVEIPGLISCSGNEDCPEDQTCQDDLTCA